MGYFCSPEPLSDSVGITVGGRVIFPATLCAGSRSDVEVYVAADVHRQPRNAELCDRIIMCPMVNAPRALSTWAFWARPGENDNRCRAYGKLHDRK